MTATDTAAPVSDPVIRKTVGAMASGGTIAYSVYLGERWIGWIGDERPWLGPRHGARQWWAAWREAGDRNARWHATGYRTRADALTALVAAAS